MNRWQPERIADMVAGLLLWMLACRQSIEGLQLIRFHWKRSMGFSIEIDHSVVIWKIPTFDENAQAIQMVYVEDTLASTPTFCATLSYGSKFAFPSKLVRKISTLARYCNPDSSKPLQQLTSMFFVTYESLEMSMNCTGVVMPGKAI